MNSRTRTLTLATSLALAAPIVLAVAQPAFASGGPGGGHGGAWTCGPTTTSTLPGVVRPSRVTVGNAGTAVLKRDVTNDGLIVGRVLARSGWTKSVPVPAGPKVTVQFQQSHTKVELEAAQSALYYGPTVLVTEITTCTR